MTEEKKVQEQPETVRPLSEKETEQVAGGRMLYLKGVVAADVEMAAMKIAEVKAQKAEVGFNVNLASEDK